MNGNKSPRQQLLDQLYEIVQRLREHEGKSVAQGLEQKELFESLFQNAREGIVIVQAGKFLRANQSFCDLVSYPLQDIIGTKALRFFREDLLTGATKKYEDLLAGKSIPPADKVVLLKQDGTEINCELTAAQIVYEGKDAILAILVDITQLLKAEEELQELRQYQLSLVEHINIWVNILNQQGDVILWNKAAEEISGYSKEEVLGHSKIWDYLYPDEKYRHEIFSKAMEIIQGGVTVQGFEGVIVTKDGKKKNISWYSRNLVNSTGQHIGSIAIGLDITEIKETNEALKLANEALRVAYDETIEGWSRALDLHDKETEGHSQRVTKMTLELARIAGMSDTNLINVQRGALLHDIGKLGVPDSILLKSAELTEDEWVQMKQHPVHAFALLSPIEYLRPAIDIPYCHHENWDGSGYPRGLKGEEIPLSARLFAVADIWDALQSDRPYRKAWSKSKTLEYINSLAGTQLDPKAVQYFKIHQSEKA